MSLESDAWLDDNWQRVGFARDALTQQRSSGLNAYLARLDRQHQTLPGYLVIGVEIPNHFIFRASKNADVTA